MQERYEENGDLYVSFGRAPKIGERYRNEYGGVTERMGVDDSAYARYEAVAKVPCKAPEGWQWDIEEGKPMLAPAAKVDNVECERLLRELVAAVKVALPSWATTGAHPIPEWARVMATAKQADALLNPKPPAPPAREPNGRRRADWQTVPCPSSVYDGRCTNKDRRVDSERREKWDYWGLEVLPYLREGYRDHKRFAEKK